MLRLVQFIQKHFSICFTIAALIGVFLPSFVPIMHGYVVMAALMTVLFLSFLKLDLKEILAQAKRPGLLSYCLAINLVVLPLITYWGTALFSRGIRMGAVLMVALPTGVAAAAITDMVKGRAALSLVLCTLSSVLVPVTIPLLFYLLFGATVELDYIGLSSKLLLLVFVPLILSQICKRTAAGAVRRVQPWSGGLSVLLLVAIIASVLAEQTDFIRANVNVVVKMLILLYVIFLLLQLAGFYTAFWLSREERTSLAVSKSVMNTALGIVLASTFFKATPEVLVFLVISEIPWSMICGLCNVYRKHFP